MVKYRVLYHIVFTTVNENHEKPGSGRANVTGADGSDIQRFTKGSDWSEWIAFSYAIEPTGKLRSTWGKIKRGLFEIITWGIYSAFLLF